MRIQNKKSAKICTKVLTYLLYLIIMLSPLFANGTADRLEALLKTSRNEEKVDILLQLSKLERNNSPENSFSYAKEALILSERLSYDKGIAGSKIEIGIFNFTKTEYELSITLFEEALTIYNNIDDLEGQGLALNALGRVFSKIESYSIAEDYFKKSLEVKAKTKNTRQVGITYMNMGDLYREAQKYDLAFDYHSKSAEIFKELKDSNNLGKAYHNIAAVFYETGENKKALEYHKMSYEIKERNNDGLGIGMSLCNMANIYIEMNECNEAIEKLNKALKIFGEMEMPDEKNYALVNLGWAYYSNKDYKTAEKYYKESMDLSIQIKNKSGIAFANIKLAELSILKKEYNKAIGYCLEGSRIYKENGKLESYSDAQLLLANAYKSKNDYKSAFAAMDEYFIANDSVHKAEKANMLSSILKKNHAENKAIALKTENSLKAAEIEKQKIIIFLLSAFILILSILFFLLIKMYKDLKNKNVMIEKSNEALLYIDSELSTDLQADLFDLSCYMSNLKDNTENRQAIEKYKEFIIKYNRLRKYVVADN